MRDFIKNYKSDIAAQVFSGLIIGAILGIIAFAPSTKPYFFKFIIFIVGNWQPLLLLLSILFIIYCMIRIRRLSRSIPALDSEINTRHVSTVQEVESRVTKVVEAEKLQRERLEKMLNEATVSAQSSLGATTSKIDALAQILETKINNFIGEIKSVRTDISAVRDSVSDVASDVYDIHRDYLLQKAKDHQDKGQRGGLLCRMQIVQLDLKKAYQWKLNESLEELYTYVKGQKIFSTEDLADVRNGLKEIVNPGDKEVANLMRRQ